MRTEKTRVAVYRRVSRDQKSYASLIGADERKINSESSMLYVGSYPAIPEAVLEHHMRNTQSAEWFAGNLDNVLWNNAYTLFPLLPREED